MSRKWSCINYESDEIKEAVVRPNFGDSISLVIDFAGEEDTRESVRFRLDRKQAKMLYKSLKKHMYK